MLKTLEFQSRSGCLHLNQGDYSASEVLSIIPWKTAVRPMLPAQKSLPKALSPESPLQVRVSEGARHRERRALLRGFYSSAYFLAGVFLAAVFLSTASELVCTAGTGKAGFPVLRIFAVPCTHTLASGSAPQKPGNGDLARAPRRCFLHHCALPTFTFSMVFKAHHFHIGLFMALPTFAFS